MADIWQASNSTEFSWLKLSVINSGNGMRLKWQEAAITHISNDDPVRWRIYASPGLNMLNPKINEPRVVLQGSGALYDHELMIRANGYLPVGDGLIPTGKGPGPCGPWLNYARLCAQITPQGASKPFSHYCWCPHGWWTLSEHAYGPD